MQCNARDSFIWIRSIERRTKINNALQSVVLVLEIKALYCMQRSRAVERQSIVLHCSHELQLK